MIESQAELTAMFERQLLLLRELVRDLLQCTAAYADMDLEEVYWHLAEQASLCDQFRRTQIERLRAWEEWGHEPTVGENQLNDWISEVEPEVTRSLQRVLTEIALTEGHSRHLNRVRETLYDGSRRTLNLLANAVAILNAYPEPLLAGQLNTSVNQLSLFSSLTISTAP